MKTYQHTQPATTILRSLCVMFVTFALASIAYHPLIPALVILAVTAWMFRSLTIAISDTELVWYFGSGWPRKSVPLSEIASVEPVRTTLLSGWGIHYTPRGWLYNVSGRGAVALKLRNGKQFCLGSDEPEELARRLRPH